MKSERSLAGSPCEMIRSIADSIEGAGDFAGVRAIGRHQVNGVAEWPDQQAFREELRPEHRRDIRKIAGIRNDEIDCSNGSDAARIGETLVAGQSGETDVEGRPSAATRPSTSSSRQMARLALAAAQLIGFAVKLDEW